MADLPPGARARYVCTRVTSPRRLLPLTIFTGMHTQERTSSSPPTGAGSLVFSVGQVLRNSLETMRQDLARPPRAPCGPDQRRYPWLPWAPTVSIRAVIRPKEESTNLCDGSREPQCLAPQVQPGAAPPPMESALRLLPAAHSPALSPLRRASPFRGTQGSDNKCLLGESCSWQPAAPGCFLSNHPSWKHRLMPASAKPSAHLRPLPEASLAVHPRLPPTHRPPGC